MCVRKTYCLCFFLLINVLSFGQTTTTIPVNNLVLASNYKTAAYASLPVYVKKGHGKQTLILIPGLGFDASVFDDFMRVNEKVYTMYAITIPGYGKTAAPPMPVADTSYGLQNWNKGVLSGLAKLIAKEKLDRPIVAGYFVQGTQLALRMAIDYPDKIGGVITIGGPAKFILVQQGIPKEYPLKSNIEYVDKYTAPRWFKTISQGEFNAGNYLPEIYSLDTKQGKRLWSEVANVPLPVMIRYLCEFFASDVTLELDKIQCPVLILRPSFDTTVLSKDINNYVQPQFIDSWEKAATKNPLITLKDIQGSSACMWIDNPKDLYAIIELFIKNNIKN
jgi:pimeloyl-ACP methyl ester carboxylesterase